MYLRSNDKGNGRFEITAASAGRADTAPRGGGAWSGFCSGVNERQTTNRKLKRCLKISAEKRTGSIDHSGGVSLWYLSYSLGRGSVRQEVTVGNNALENIAELERGMSEGERAVTTPRIGWRKLTDPGD